MILSAGFGTRLKPITDTIPKALVPYKGKPLIVHQIQKLKSLNSINIDEIIVNIHHHKEKIKEFFEQNDFKVKVTISDEEEILGTGGGILNSEKYLKDDSHFLVMNVDIISDIDIEKFIQSHSEENLATLAVQKRKTSRYLEFDSNMNLVKRQNDNSKEQNLYAFNGMHIISNKIFDLGLTTEFCDVINIYLDAINKGFVVKGYNSGDVTFKDIGKIENLE